MTDEDFNLWLRDYSEDQIESLRNLRTLILEHTHGLEEAVNKSKWLTDYVFYSNESTMVYAIGPKGTTKTTLHMMPFYGSAELQERHGAALAPFFTGKSCIAFRKFSDLPTGDLVNIFVMGTSAKTNLSAVKKSGQVQ